MSDALDDVEFLARSENRVAVLRTLESQPKSRSTLQEEAGVSRVTIGRILDDFEERGWVTKTPNREYALTPTGQMIAGGFDEVLQTVETATHLDSVVQWLPTETMSFDLRRLGGAEIVLPTGPDPAAPTRRAGERLHKTSDVRLLMSVIVSEVVEACWDATVNGDQQLEAVFTPDVIETITTDTTMAPKLKQMMESENVTVYRSERSFPHILGLLDDITAFGVTDEENLPRAYFETTDGAVREWAEATYERHREAAVPIAETMSSEQLW